MFRTPSPFWLAWLIAGAAVALTGCSVGLCPIGSDACVVGEAPRLRFSGSDHLPLGPCKLYQLSAVTADGGAYSSAGAITASLSGLSPATAYASFSDCRLGSNPLSSLSIPAGQSSTAFYLKSASAGSANLVATPSTTALSAGNLALTIFSQPQNLTVDFGGYVRAVAPVLDGSNKVYFAGDFRRYGDTAAGGVARMNADGTLDTAFNSTVGIAGGAESLSSLAWTSNGLYLAGSFTSYRGSSLGYVARIKTDGSLDTSFATGSGFDAGTLAVAEATDGTHDVFYGGFFNNYQSTTYHGIIRLHPDGSIETNFANDAALFGGAPLVLLPDPSGAIYLGGNFTGTNCCSAPRIVKLGSDGTQDATFNFGTGFNGTTEALAFDTIAATKYLYVGGNFTNYNGTAINRIVRLNASTAALDGTFNVGTGFDGDVTSIVPIAGNKVYVGGLFQHYNGTLSPGMVLLNPNGSIDATFTLQLPSSGIPQFAMNVDGGGAQSLYVISHGRPQIARLTLTGAIDPAFDPVGGYNNTVGAIYEPLDDSGKSWVGGLYQNYPDFQSTSSYLVRLNADGTVDSTGMGSGPNGWIGAIAATPDGSGDFLITGNFSQFDGHAQGGVARLRSDGSFVSTFNGGGSGGFNSWVQPLVFAPDGSGKFYTGGLAWQYNGGAFGKVGRLNADGTLDGAFNTGTGISGAGQVVNALAVDPVTGKLYVGGDFTSYDGNSVNYLVRLNTDGGYDPTFAIGSGFDAPVMSLALDANRKLLVAGNFTTYQGSGPQGLVRLNLDGSPDATFVQGGGFDDHVQSVALAQDGSGDIWAAGYFSNYGATAVTSLARLHANGTLVPFNQGSGLPNLATFVYPYQDGSGAVFVSGYFSWYNGRSCGAGCRILPDGTLY